MSNRRYPPEALAVPRIPRGDHWRSRDGKAKQPLTRTEAGFMEDVMAERYGGTWSSYVCRVCRAWHVGRVGWRAMTSWREPFAKNERLHFLWPELGERTVGCLKQENHPDAAKAGAHLRSVLRAAERRRQGR